MSHPTTGLGFDRYMALRWVNMALELRLLNHDPDHAFHQLRKWLYKEIPGKETARKTAAQTRRLWLAKGDQYHELRQQVMDNDLTENKDYWSLLHYGLSLNVFPLFWDVCQITGRLLNLQTICHRSDIHQRVQEKYGNPASTRAATDRVFQTLADWEFLIDRNGEISVQVISVDDIKLTQWLIFALMSVRSVDKLPFADGINASELLGIRFEDARTAIRLSSYLRIERIMDAEMLIMTT